MTPGFLQQLELRIIRQLNSERFVSVVSHGKEFAACRSIGIQARDEPDIQKPAVAAM